jgi:hypothetical protein
MKQDLQELGKFLHRSDTEKTIADHVKKVERERMPFVSKINDAFNAYWQKCEGEEPKSIELTVEQWEMLKTEVLAAGFTYINEYVPSGEEVFQFRGINVYVERDCVLRLESEADVENGEK